MKGAAWDVFLPPLHGQSVISSLLDDICDIILLVAHVLHGDLFARGGGPVDPDQQHIGTWREKKCYSIWMYQRKRKRRTVGARGKDQGLPIGLL